MTGHSHSVVDVVAKCVVLRSFMRAKSNRRPEFGNRGVK